MPFLEWGGSSLFEAVSLLLEAGFALWTASPSSRDVTVLVEAVPLQ